MSPVPPRPLVLALCLAWLAAAAAPAAAQKSKDQNTARAAATRLDKALDAEQIPEAVTAIASFSRFDEPASVDALLTVFERATPALHPNARRVLGGFSQPDSLERLVAKGASHRSPTVRAQTLLALGEARPAGLDWAGQLGAGLGDDAPAVRAVAVRELSRARVDSHLDRIFELATDPSEQVRAEVPAALARLGGTRALPQLETLLEDPRWRVRLETIGALGDLRTPEVVELLIETMELERGRLQEDVVAQLERLTGKAFGFDVAAWKDFVLRAPPDFLSNAAAAPAVRLGTPRFGIGGVRYHTLGTASQRFVLVTDLSGSMDTPIKLPGANEPTPRIALVRDELTRLIGGLDQSIGFDLVTFRDRVEIWKPHMQLASDSLKRAALGEVEDYRAEGGTNIFGALEAVFDLAQAAMEDPAQSLQDVDTLFLLSDGAPSDGLIRDTGLLLQYVAERNRTLRLRIHCISLVAPGEGEAEKFLKALAELGGGGYSSPATSDG
ncbi:MAG TPA: HEAT repeat domain-containing protein [Planctomycetota bacterium]|nr:HEAT repeat domain-containing protein [Planctomycetota bacterium]